MNQIHKTLSRNFGIRNSSGSSTLYMASSFFASKLHKKKQPLFVFGLLFTIFFYPLSQALSLSFSLILSLARCLLLFPSFDNCIRFRLYEHKILDIKFKRNEFVCVCLCVFVWTYRIIMKQEGRTRARIQKKTIDKNR